MEQFRRNGNNDAGEGAKSWRCWEGTGVPFHRSGHTSPITSVGVLMLEGGQLGVG